MSRGALYCFLAVVANVPSFFFHGCSSFNGARLPRQLFLLRVIASLDASRVRHVHTSCLIPAGWLTVVYHWRTVREDEASSGDQVERFNLTDLINQARPALRTSRFEQFCKVHRARTAESQLPTVKITN